MDTSGYWTPLAQSRNRLLRSQTDAPGSEAHFRDAYLALDALARLHSAVAIGALSLVNETGARERLERLIVSATSSPGDWLAEMSGALSELAIDESDRERFASVFELRDWLMRRKKRPDDADFEAVSKPLVPAVAGALEVDESKVSMKSPRELMDASVTIRNKSFAHGAPGKAFYATYAPVFGDAVIWLIENTPLNKMHLFSPLPALNPPRARRLTGTDPIESFEIQEQYRIGAAYCSDGDSLTVDLGAIVYVDISDNRTYLANGHWKEPDHSAEFLCHSMEAASLEQGRMRIKMPEFGQPIRPLGPSETEGQHDLVTDARAWHNLPKRMGGYVDRPEYEQDIAKILRDPARWHMLIIRGAGGFGKTSLLLEMCHELAVSADCPYQWIFWASARDVDLTVSGPKDVRRSEETLDDIYDRFLVFIREALSEDEMAAQDAAAHFESALQGDGLGSFLVVLDNFETFEDQERAAQLLEDVVRPPSKIVLTSRKSFPGKIQREVGGMRREEAHELIERAARDAGREAILTETMKDQIFERCGGHPYPMKIVASQVTGQTTLNHLLHEVTGRRDLLDALFRRSFEDLDDDAPATFVFFLVGRFSKPVSEQAVRAVAERLDFDLHQAVQQLKIRSLLESELIDGHVYFDLPVVAKEFARRFVAGHILRNQVDESVEILQRWPKLLSSDPLLAAEQIVSSLEAQTPSANVERQAVDILFSLAKEDDSVWVLRAAACKLLGRPQSEIEDSLKRAIEADPDNRGLYDELAENVMSDQRKRIDLRVQAAVTDPTDWERASKVANLLNGLYKQDRGLYEPVEWRSLMSPIAEILERNLGSLNGDAFSRLAWLLNNMQAGDRVNAVISRGLEVDPANGHLKNLRQKSAQRALAER